MNKLWAGRFRKEMDKTAFDFNSSIFIDSCMYAEDIIGSIAHAEMLGEVGIISKEDSERICAELKSLLEDLKNRKIEIDTSAEDIHTFVECELIKKIGETGKKLHTARSRNDQTVLDLRMYLKNAVIKIRAEIIKTLQVLVEIAKNNMKTIMPGYTHLQRAQPVTFAHYMLSYASMFIRDDERLTDTFKRLDVMPLGSCALAGTTYPINRESVAQKLSFNKISFNSIDGVSDRDFVIELASDLALIMMHLSRFSEEITIWSSWEFKFIELADGFSTGSSIMPQKKNPDIAELVRGKTGRVYGNLMGILTVMKGLPLSYNKDMQEDKESIFDSVNTVLFCLPVFTDMLKSMTVNNNNMALAAENGFINATDAADYLVKKGMPFRDAYKIIGEIVAICMEKNLTLNTLAINEYKKYSELFEEDLYSAIEMINCVEKRISFGAPGTLSVKKQIEIVEEYIKNYD